MPFDALHSSHPGVSLGALWQDKLTFPPLTPRRIVREQHFIVEDATTSKRIHGRRLRHSAGNLQRRVEDHAPSLLAAWISTGSETNARASFMTYAHREGDVSAWYSSFERSAGQWRVRRVKGIAKGLVDAWARDESAPISSVLER